MLALRCLLGWSAAAQGWLSFTLDFFKIQPNLLHPQQNAELGHAINHGLPCSSLLQCPLPPSTAYQCQDVTSLLTYMDPK